MIVEQLVPTRQDVDLSEVCDSFKFAECQGAFADELVALIDDVAQLLFSDQAARQYPELQALAFFMRKSNVLSMKPKPTEDDLSTVRVPTGRVLHFAPANVDTMFVYSWLLSAVSGNVNLVRVSNSRRAPQSDLICELLNRALESHPKLQKTISVVSYDHSPEATARLSSVADLRVIWGGDSTIDEIRKEPLRPGARDLCFPDRFSIAVIDSKKYMELSHEAKESTANDFFNDSYWFDQAACSSPRQVFWCGTAEDNVAAKKQFFECLSKILAKRSFKLDSGPALSKMTNIYDSVIELPVKNVTTVGNELAVLELDDECSILPSAHSNFGTFFSADIKELVELLPLLTRKVQTLTYLGFEKDALKGFAQAANGAGIDRIVPIGQALSFHRLWDGFDLIDEYTRLVHIR